MRLGSRSHVATELSLIHRPQCASVRYGESSDEGFVMPGPDVSNVVSEHDIFWRSLRVDNLQTSERLTYAECRRGMLAPAESSFFSTLLAGCKGAGARRSCHPVSTLKAYEVRYARH